MDKAASRIRLLLVRSARSFERSEMQILFGLNDFFLWRRRPLLLYKPVAP